MAAAMCSLFGGLSLGSEGFMGSRAALQQRVGLSLTARAPLEIEAKKKWEKPNLTKNGKPVFQKMHVKKGDSVIVIRGADKGKVTTVVQALPKLGQIVCDDVNVKMRNIKTQEGETRQELKESPIDSSAVMHYSKTKKVRSRIKKEIQDDGTKVRVLVATGEILPN